MAEALGIPLHDSPPSLLMSLNDFHRLRRHYEDIVKVRTELAVVSR
jgi:hypothetical protein